MQSLLEEIAFQDRSRALANMNLLESGLPEGIQSRIHFLLASSANPDGGLYYLVRLRKEKPDAFHRLVHNPATLLHLVTVFSHTRFLAEEILQQPEWLDEISAESDLHRVLSAEELRVRLEDFVSRDGRAPLSALALAQFRRRQILRILVRDALRYCTLSEVTEELSNLADAILDSTYRNIRDELIIKHGSPQPCGFSVISLGKLGGRELNYSSDIDLMFVYAANGMTDGKHPISNKEFYKKVANQYTTLLSTYTAEGLCYRVDLRLRPDGSLGEVCSSLDGARGYYQNRARDWELQMLIKARVSAGEREPGRELLEFVEPLIYSSTLDFSTVESMSATRERIQEKLHRRRRGKKELDVKLTRGGIRDIEFLVQCLQRLHGGRDAWLRHGGTLISLLRLRDKGFLSDKEYARLYAAYDFLRRLEHCLQVDEDQQRHTLPEDPEALELLARRMLALPADTAPSAERLMRNLNRNLEEVQEIYDRVIHAQQPIYYTGVTGPATAVGPSTGLAPAPPVPDVPEPPSANVIRFLDQRAPALGATLARRGLRKGSKAFQHFLERILSETPYVDWLNSDEVLAGYLLDLFEHSQIFAEQLIRYPEMISVIRRLRQYPGESRSYAVIAASIADPVELRRFFRCEMLRLQCESICLRAPIFTTLGRTSELADATISAAYQMALTRVSATHPPSSPSYHPVNQMMVIALGRLGMREFDLASDADLVFVLPDRDSVELAYWTRVASQMIDVLTAYTGEGAMFAVDTRLRPNGRAGELVQLESSYKDYFAKSAEAWEGIAYMKSRAVAGGAERATRFLNELQEVDWRRYGQSGRSQQLLRQMRLRLEREQGPANPFKAGRGGYYDIDFALMYLRLKGAGIFFKVLNTPERIDVIEKMGHLDHADALFLHDAATLYRAIDHGIRVMLGYTEGALPTSVSQLETVTALTARWTPEHLHDQPLADELDQLRERTREFFDRLFGAA